MPVVTLAALSTEMIWDVLIRLDRDPVSFQSCKRSLGTLNMYELWNVRQLQEGGGITNHPRVVTTIKLKLPSSLAVGLSTLPN